MSASKAAFRESFWSLYGEAVVTQDKVYLAYVLSLLAFQEIKLQFLSAFMVIAQNQAEFADIRIPDFDSYEHTDQTDLIVSKIENVIRANVRSFEQYCRERNYNICGAYQLQRNLDQLSYEERRLVEDLDRWRSRYNNAINQDVDKILNVVKQQWPCQKVTFPSSLLLCIVNRSAVKDDINAWIFIWYKNRTLKLFLTKVEQKLTQVWNRKLEIQIP
eukprot:TRINITY_DN74315_c0_g1_i1.p2 TRINITY_DN74315_c0_g1~~TRINITY_DN74315_c0_g1_i1.p2  ORF type:complete len:253 (+),score=13.83 TRINITY_DN74315_c0_g1_i1:111-761(+)